MLAAISFSTFILGSRQLLKTINPSTMSLYVVPTAGIFVLVGSFFNSELTLPSTTFGWQIVFAFAFLSTTLPMLAFFGGLLVTKE
jgi:drug/metabolite transporter (DMT)-like permease